MGLFEYCEFSWRLELQTDNTVHTVCNKIRLTETAPKRATFNQLPVPPTPVGVSTRPLILVSFALTGHVG